MHYKQKSTCLNVDFKERETISNFDGNLTTIMDENESKEYLYPSKRKDIV